jgi:glycosyltransferase involved in cell wall biosynthesis
VGNPAKGVVVDCVILVVGVARNCARHVPGQIRTISCALQGFYEVNWLVIESDSDDDTQSALAALAAEDAKFRFISLGTLRHQLPKRTERIAHCRNRYLDEIRRNPLYQHVDFVVVADLDGMNSLLTEEAIKSCWEREEWDVCTANQRGPYYDIYALRHEWWSPNDWCLQYSFLISRGMRAARAYSASNYARMIRVREDSEWLEVDSAFGGLAIYRKQAMSNGEYIGLAPDGTEQCEHVAFHGQLRKENKRIFINPRLINAGYTRHWWRVAGKLTLLATIGIRGTSFLEGWLRRKPVRAVSSN